MEARIELLKLGKRLGKISISQASRTLGFCKSTIHELLNTTLQHMFDKIVFGYNTVYYILKGKSGRRRFYFLYLRENGNVVRGQEFAENLRKEIPPPS